MKQVAYLLLATVVFFQLQATTNALDSRLLSGLIGIATNVTDAIEDTVEDEVSGVVEDAVTVISDVVDEAVTTIVDVVEEFETAFETIVQETGNIVAGLPLLTAGLADFLVDSLEYEGAEPADMTPDQNAEYDFIVVGAGSAGAIVASRLSEIANVTVLLLEAGGSESLYMDIPLSAPYLQFSSNINWEYQAEPSDTYCLGMTDRSCKLPQGKVMGGSSVLNFMLAMRGNKQDYDRWEELGNEGWSYEDVLPYFKKLENIGISDLTSDEELHSTSGPMPINYPKYHTELATAFLEAGTELGFDLVDYNGEQQTGFSYVQTTTANGERFSSSRAYLHPIKNRTNLFVSKNSRVSKILIDEAENRTTGVRFLKGDAEIEVKAGKEVILSAGAFASAQILMLSGIGPAEHLAEIGIPLIKDAPVGKNLMDHVAYGGFVVQVNESVSIVIKEVLYPGNPYLEEYFNDREGPITVPGACEAVAYLNVDAPHDRSSWPNVELFFQGGSIVSGQFIHNVFGITETLWDQTYKEIQNDHSWQLMPLLMHPLSRGEVLLRDGNVTTSPILIPNYMSDPEDVRIMVAGIRAAQNVTKTVAMQRYGSRLYDVQLPGCKNCTYDSDDYWECAARTLTFNYYHYSGTVKMGPAGDPTAVVNPRLQVYGVSGLRVAGASIMPEIPTAHTAVPTMMIGEKLADMVKEDWAL